MLQQGHQKRVVFQSTSDEDQLGEGGEGVGELPLHGVGRPRIGRPPGLANHQAVPLGEASGWVEEAFSVIFGDHPHTGRVAVDGERADVLLLLQLLLISGLLRENGQRVNLTIGGPQQDGPAPAEVACLQSISQWHHLQEGYHTEVWKWTTWTTGHAEMKTSKRARKLESGWNHFGVQEE